MKPKSETRFSFGENWERFVDQHFNEARVRTAERHLLKFLDVPSLQGKSFMDLGCGSGIHSLAAFDAGAETVVSIDLDDRSVETTMHLRSLRKNPSSWVVRQGSVLDRAFLDSLRPAQVVYSWGVLHHTGRLWEAIENAAGMLDGPSALLYLGLYVTTSKAAYWERIKRKYNAASPARKRLMDYQYLVRYILLPMLVRGKSPTPVLCAYDQRRGMDLMTDVRDWLGGYPYEHATPGEVIRFCAKRLDLHTLNIEAAAGFAEYLFVKQ